MGVTTMPSSVEADALHTAAGMLPRHGREGNRRLHRGRQGAQKQHAQVHLGRDQRLQHRGAEPSPAAEQRKGGAKMLRVQPPIGPRPPRMAWRDSLAPCRKNSRLTTPVVATSAPGPWGRMPATGLARTTVAHQGQREMVGGEARQGHGSSLCQRRPQRRLPAQQQRQQHQRKQHEPHKRPVGDGAARKVQSMAVRSPGTAEDHGDGAARGSSRPCRRSRARRSPPRAGTTAASSGGRR